MLPYSIFASLNRTGSADDLVGIVFLLFCVLLQVFVLDV